MINEEDIRIVLGSKRYASSVDTDIWIQTPLIGDRRNMVEGDRSITINLEEQFNEERTNSDVFRISGKIVNIINNSISGKTAYQPYRDNLYYTNSISNATINNPYNPNVLWEGYPQFNEFSIIRNEGIVGHITYVPKSSTTYNWAVYLTYAYSSDTEQIMSFTDQTYNTTNTFIASDGIPFTITNDKFNGKRLIYFNCATNHNLEVGEFVEITIPSNTNGFGGVNIFSVYSLGNGKYDSESNVFSIYNLKFLDSETTNGKVGNFKRIKNIQNSGETKSKYYVRLHKTLTDVTECKLNPAGFENNPFPTKFKLEYSALTPNNVERISVKDGSKTVTFTFNSDIKINGIKDNLNRPITELFTTIIQRGYMGYFNPTPPNSNIGLDVGWEFNFLKNTIDPWWNHNSLNNKDNITVGNYIANNKTFNYNNLLNVGHILKGDFCEYNFIEQKEYVLSPMYHKYSYNPIYFLDNSDINYPSGYVYTPHHKIQIRTFGNNIMYSQKENVDIVPKYAGYSKYEETFIWRDIYNYGYIDEDDNGVDYPFLNGAHYPFKDILFLQKPIQQLNIVETTLINQPTTDPCE